MEHCPLHHDAPPVLNSRDFGFIRHGTDDTRRAWCAMLTEIGLVSFITDVSGNVGPRHTVCCADHVRVGDRPKGFTNVRRVCDVSLSRPQHCAQAPGIGSVSNVAVSSIRGSGSSESVDAPKTIVRTGSLEAMFCSLIKPAYLPSYISSHKLSSLSTICCRSLGSFSRGNSFEGSAAFFTGTGALYRVPTSALDSLEFPAPMMSHTPPFRWARELSRFEKCYQRAIVPANDRMQRGLPEVVN